MRVATPYRELAEAVRQRRQELGLTQPQVAELGGLSLVFVVRVEAGKSTVRLDRLIELMSTLGLRFRLEEGRDGIVIAHELG